MNLKLPIPDLPDPGTKPEFFRFGHNTFGGRGNPWASYITLPTDPGIWDRFGAKKYLRKNMRNPLAYIDEVGSKWSDMVGSGGGTFDFMVTDRVVKSLHAAGIDCFKATPVEIVKIESRKLRNQEPPNYFVIEITGRMNFDLKAGKKEYRFGTDTSTRWVPLVDSWDGSDLFVAGNSDAKFTYCTEKVLLLARQAQWSNFRFYPIDSFSNLNISWKKGIDYLGRKWPPRRWYPPRLSDGKTLEEWLDAYEAANSGGKWYDTYRALLDLDDVAATIEGATKRFRSCKKSERGRWARLLDQFWNCGLGPLLPADVLEAIEESRAET